MEIDSQEAVSILLDQATIETSTAVVWAIGRALDGKDVAEPLMDWMASHEPNRRRAAYRLCGRIHASDSMLTALRKGLDDLDETVARAAKEALDHQRDMKETAILMSALHRENEEQRRWVLLDSFLAHADPGDRDGPPPGWAVTVSERLSLPMQLHLAKRMEERRKAMADEAMSRDKL